MKHRYDPDDDRVRIRRVLDDDAILAELAQLREWQSDAVGEIERMRDINTALLALVDTLDSETIKALDELDYTNAWTHVGKTLRLMRGRIAAFRNNK